MMPIHCHTRCIQEGKKIRFKDGLIALWTLLHLHFSNGRRWPTR